MKEKKLVFRKIEEGFYPGLYGLFTEEGEILASQTQTEFISKGEGIAEIVVTFGVDGDKLRFEP